MKPHIAACLEDIEERITDLTNIRDQIVNLFGGKPETGPQLLLQNKAIQRKIDRNDERDAREIAKAKPKAAQPRKGVVSRADALNAGKRMAASAATLPQPFGSREITKAAHVTSEQAYRWAWCAVNKHGWLRKLGKDQFERTAKFPGATEGKRVSIPGLDNDTKETLQAKLETALKGRDSAVASGNATLRDVYQSSIDRLEKQLGL